MNWERPDVQAGLRKGRGTRDQIANSHWFTEKVRELQKISSSASLTTRKPLTVWITTNWKILKETGIPDHLTCLLRNLYSGQEVTVKTRHRTTDWFKIGKGVWQGCISSPCLFSLHTSTSCKMPGWVNHKLESRLLAEISITSDMQLISPYGRKWRRTKEPLDEGERGEWKNWIKTQHSKN